MNIETRVQMEKACRALAQSTGRDKILCEMPNGSYEIRDKGDEGGGKVVFTGYADSPFGSLFG